MLIQWITLASKLPLPVAQTSMIDPNPTLEQICGLIKKSLASCEQHHTLCQCRLRSPSSTFSPKRLLHLSTSGIRVVEDQKIEKWACLSYCWGQLPDPLRLTKNELSAFKTEIPSTRLPQLFKDVAKVCQLLGIDYLWIDALCIIQDRDADWLEQAGQMARIYAESTFTIAAEDTSNPNQGLIQSSYKRPAWVKLEGYEGIFFRKFVDERRFGSDREDSLLAKRAWTYQEIQLSPRLVRLKEKDVLWECPQTGHTHFQHEHRLRSQNASPNRLLSRSKLEQDVATRAHELWRRLVEEYTSRQLTFSTDRMAAFAAVAEKFGDLFQMKDDFTMGFWYPWLLADLEWHRKDGEPLTRIPRCRSTLLPTPSWSWASVDAPVKLDRLGMWYGATPDVDSLARIIDRNIMHCGSPFLGLALRAQITIEAPFFEVEAYSQRYQSLNRKGLRVRILNSPQMCVDGRSVGLSRFIQFMASIFDVDEESPETRRRLDLDLRFNIAIFTVRNCHEFTGLWLRKVDGWPLRYRRLGVCHFSCHSFENVLRLSDELWNESFVTTLSGMIAPASMGRIMYSRNTSRMTEEQRAQIRAQAEQEFEYWKNAPAREEEERRQLREALSSIPRQVFVLE